MFNRYVDGLGTWAPTEGAIYARIGVQLGEEGYLRAVSQEPMPVVGA